MKRITSIETIQTISFEKEKKPLKKLRINVKMTKKFLIHLLFHMLNLTLTKCIRILLVYTCIHYGLSNKLWLAINNKF